MPDQRVLLLAAALAFAAASAQAQAWREPSSGFPETRDWPMPPPQQQTAPAEQSTPAPESPAAGAAKKKAAKSAPPAPGDAATAAKPAPAAKSAATPAPGRSVNCAGVFARTSNHLQLAMAFNSRNVTYTEVDGPQGSKLMASVVFPKDPKRRLEVLWQNEPMRSDTALIVIGGQSQWVAPKGLRLGLPLAAVEKLNGRPFRISGFDQENGGSALGWEGGALADLTGGCQVGVRFARGKVPDAALAAAMGKEFTSADPAMRGAKPTVAEIILGYPQ